MNILIESPNATSSHISDSQWHKIHDLEDQYNIEIRSIEPTADQHRVIVDLDLASTTLCDIFGAQAGLPMHTLDAFTYSLIKILENDDSERLREPF